MNFCVLLVTGVFLLWVKPSMAIQGKVIDAITSQPIAGAVVSIEGGASLTTDAQGLFNYTSAVIIKSNENGSMCMRGNQLCYRQGGNQIGAYKLKWRLTSVYGKAIKQGIETCHSDGCAIGVLPSQYSGLYMLHWTLFPNRSPVNSVSSTQTLYIHQGDVVIGKNQSDVLANTSDANSKINTTAKIGALSVTAKFTHASYRIREASLDDAIENVIPLIPKTTTTAYYLPPPQVLTDGIAVGNIRTQYPSILNNFERGLDKLYNGQYKEVHSILVFYRDQLLFEDYFSGVADTFNFEAGVVKVGLGSVQWDRNALHYVASANKTVSSLVGGLALSESGISLNTSIAPYLPTYTSVLTGTKANITFQHLLTMTLGLTWDEWASTDLTNMWKASDPTLYMLSKTMKTAPGGEWTYNSGAPSVMWQVVNQLRKEGAAEYARQKFFAPMGITNYRQGLQKNGLPEGGAKLFLRSRDMLKIGKLMIGKGKYNGVQVVPEAYVTAATSKQYSARPKSDNDYGYYVWVRSLPIAGSPTLSYFAAEGDGGNYISCFPDRELVIVTTGGNYLKWDIYEPQIRAILTSLVPLFPPR